MKKSKFKKRIIIIGILITAILIAVSLFLLNPSWMFSLSNGWEGELDLAQAFDKDQINIVLLGFDRNEARDQVYRIFRPDTIMIASINFRTRDVSLVNIPRDTYVRISGHGIDDKINHAYMYGHDKPGAEDPHRSGIDTTVETIQDFLGGVPIHYYVAVDMDAVVEIIDTVGGINYDVEHPVRAIFSGNDVLVEQGYQLLDGQKFLHYVRDRSRGGDTGRSQRQQDILIAAFSQLKQKGRIKDLPDIYRSLTGNVETNLSPAQITALAVFGLKVNPETIPGYVFSGATQFAPQGSLDIAYIVVDEKARVELIREVFGVEVTERPRVTLPGPRGPKPNDPEQIPSQPQQPEPDPPADTPAPKPEAAPGDPQPPEEEAATAEEYAEEGTRDDTGDANTE